MRYIGVLLFCGVYAAPVAAATPADERGASELCSIRTVAVVGDDGAAKDARKRVEKKTWMKKVNSADQADGILNAQIMLTSFSISMSNNRVTSADREGYVEMTLKQRASEKVIWEGRRDLGSSNIVDGLLASLQAEAGCARH